MDNWAIRVVAKTIVKRQLPTTFLAAGLAIRRLGFEVLPLLKERLEDFAEKQGEHLDEAESSQQTRHTMSVISLGVDPGEGGSADHDLCARRSCSTKGTR